MTKQPQSMPNNSLRKIVNPQFRKLKTPKILQLAYLQNWNFAKKNMSQISADIYK